MNVSLQSETMGIFGWTLEEKFTKELKKEFPLVTDSTSKNLYKVWLEATKIYKRVPENNVDVKIFEDYIYANTGIDRGLINKFINITKLFIVKGIINVAKINPNVKKSNWQWVFFPALGVVGLIAASRFAGKIQGIKALKKVSV